MLYRRGPRNLSRKPYATKTSGETKTIDDIMVFLFLFPALTVANGDT